MPEVWSDFFDLLPDAVFLTLQITFFGFLIGQVIAATYGSALHCSSGVLNYCLRSYPFFFRGTPLLIQLFILYYGISQFMWVRESIFWVVLASPVGCAIVAVGLNAGAYGTELVRGALSNLPSGQREAAASLGFNRVQTLLYVELPQAYRILIPSLSNELIFVLKGSALASTITLIEITGLTKTFIAKTFSPFEFFFISGLCYVAIGFSITKLFRYLNVKYAVRT